MYTLLSIIMLLKVAKKAAYQAFGPSHPEQHNGVS